MASWGSTCCLIWFYLCDITELMLLFFFSQSILIILDNQCYTHALSFEHFAHTHSHINMCCKLSCAAALLLLIKSFSTHGGQWFHIEHVHKIAFSKFWSKNLSYTILLHFLCYYLQLSHPSHCVLLVAYHLLIIFINQLDHNQIPGMSWGVRGWFIISVCLFKGTGFKSHLHGKQ